MSAPNGILCTLFFLIYGDMDVVLSFKIQIVITIRTVLCFLMFLETDTIVIIALSGHE